MVIEPHLSRGFKPKWRNWQPRHAQNVVVARPWGFESLLRHCGMARDGSLVGLISLQTRFDSGPATMSCRRK